MPAPNGRYSMLPSLFYRVRCVHTCIADGFCKEFAHEIKKLKMLPVFIKYSIFFHRIYILSE